MKGCGVQQWLNVNVVANGCPENRLDAARLQAIIKGKKINFVKNYRHADLIIFVACGLTTRSEDASLEMIKKIRRISNPSTELVVCGCLPRINLKLLRKIYKGTVYGPEEIDWVFSKLGIRKDNHPVYANAILPFTRSLGRLRGLSCYLRDFGVIGAMAKLVMTPLRYKLDKKVSIVGPNTYYIKVATGCTSRCSFCAIKNSRGKLESKSLHQIVEEFDEGLRRGYRVFALIGTEVGAYGIDRGTSIVALLKELVKRDSDYVIKIRNMHPRQLIDMLQELREIFKTGKITYLSSAVESGNNRILSLMRRGYRVEDFKSAIALIKREFPQINIRTQVMVGFPSETRAEFMDSVKLVDQMEFDFVEVYKYSPRPNIEAATFEGKVSDTEARRRFVILYTKSLCKIALRNIYPK